MPEDQVFWVRDLEFCVHYLKEKKNSTKGGGVTEAYIFEKTCITLGFQSHTCT